MSIKFLGFALILAIWMITPLVEWALLGFTKPSDSSTNFIQLGFQVLTHSCYLAQPLAHCPPTIACLEDCPPVLHGFPSLWKAYAAIPPCPYVKLCCGSKSITIPSSWIRINDVLSIPAYPRLLTLLHTSPCHCKCKTFLLPNFPLSPQDLLPRFYALRL